MDRPFAEPGHVVVFTDVVCGWSTVHIHRFREARRRLGLEGTVVLDPQLFLLEDINRFPIPKRLVESEIPVLGALAPELGWKPWQRDPGDWPVSSLLANEAVHAAKEKSAAAAEELDFALRLAFFRDSRCITMRHEILEVARSCPGVDDAELEAALDDGRARRRMMDAYHGCHEAVQGSPHFFFADGSDVHNPRLTLHWNGEQGAGYPVVERDDPTVWDDLVRRAADS